MPRKCNECRLTRSLHYYWMKKDGKRTWICRQCTMKPPRQWFICPRCFVKQDTSQLVSNAIRVITGRLRCYICKSCRREENRQRKQQQ